jgi:hypothetical protein
VWEMQCAAVADVRVTQRVGGPVGGCIRFAADHTPPLSEPPTTTWRLVAMDLHDDVDGGGQVGRHVVLLGVDDLHRVAPARHVEHLRSTWPSARHPPAGSVGACTGSSSLPACVPALHETEPPARLLHALLHIKFLQATRAPCEQHLLCPGSICNA